MSQFDSKNSMKYPEGQGEEYVDLVHVFVDAEAVRPGSTKIREISIKPVTVHFLNLIYYPLPCRCNAILCTLCGSTCMLYSRHGMRLEMYNPKIVNLDVSTQNILLFSVQLLSKIRYLKTMHRASIQALNQRDIRRVPSQNCGLCFQQHQMD